VNINEGKILVNYGSCLTTNVIIFLKKKKSSQTFTYTSNLQLYLLKKKVFHAMQHQNTADKYKSHKSASKRIFG
jgi:hypothetical protein